MCLVCVCVYIYTNLSIWMVAVSEKKSKTKKSTRTTANDQGDTTYDDKRVYKFPFLFKMCVCAGFLSLVLTFFLVSLLLLGGRIGKKWSTLHDVAFWWHVLTYYKKKDFHHTQKHFYFFWTPPTKTLKKTYFRIAHL